MKAQKLLQARKSPEPRKSLEPRKLPRPRKLPKAALAALLAALSAAAALTSCAVEKGGCCAETYTAYTAAMDTSATILVYGNENRQAAEDCARLFEKMDAELSVTNEKSAVFALNRDGETGASEDLTYLINQSNRLKAETGGAFNVCVYPIVKLWGFTTGEYRVPSDAEVEAAVSLLRSAAIRAEGGRALLSEGAEADFGGIAKGYASEKMASLLKTSGVKAAVISLGGNIRTVGAKPDGAPWRIGINSPKGGGKGGGLIGTLEVGECAVVTSGSYLRCFTSGGRFCHHIIDPATGCPAESGLVSVTVVASDAALADGLSTAFFVMGAEKARALAKKLGVEAVFVTDDTIKVTAGLKDSFAPDETAGDAYTVEYFD